MERATDTGNFLTTLPKLGQEFEGFIIEKELPRGGQARVYRAWQTQLGRSVALKLLPSGFATDEDTLKRFTAEIAAVAKMSHPNIVQVYEAGELDSHPYFTMEYLDGQDCESLIKSGPLGPDEAASLIEQISRATHEAHRNGIVHRDIKPGNIITRADGTPVLTDFGLAQDLLHSAQLTQTGVSMGTPAYMSPEQARGERNRVGVKSDIYALGATTYTLLTGKRPVQGDSAYEIMVKVAENHGPKWTRTEQEDIPTDLRAILEMAMSNDPGKRYGNAEDFADDLERFLRGEWVVARSRNKFIKSLIRVRKYSSVAAVVVLSLGLAGSLIYTGLATNSTDNGQDNIFAKKPLSPINPAGSEEEFQKTFGDEGSWTKSGATASMGINRSLLLARDNPDTPIRVSPKDPACWGDFELQVDLLTNGMDKELTLLIGMPESQDFNKTAYALQFGSEARNRIALYRLGVPVAATSLDVPMLENAWYSVTIRRTGMTIDLQISDAADTLLAEISHDDPFPALISPRQRFGIEAYAAHLALRNMTVGHRDNNHSDALLLFSIGQYEESALRLTALLEERLKSDASASDKDARAENLYLLARCRFQQENFEVARNDCDSAKLLISNATLRSNVFLLSSAIATKLGNDKRAIAQLRIAAFSDGGGDLYFDALNRAKALEAIEPDRALPYYEFVSDNALGQPWATCESLQHAATIRLQAAPIANRKQAILELDRASGKNYQKYGHAFSSAARTLFELRLDEGLDAITSVTDRMAAVSNGYNTDADTLKPCIAHALWMARVTATFVTRETDTRVSRWQQALLNLDDSANTKLQALLISAESQDDARKLEESWRKLGESLNPENPEHKLASAVTDFFLSPYIDEADLMRRRNLLVAAIRTAAPEKHWIANASPVAFADYCVALVVSRRNVKLAISWLQAATSSPDAGIFDALYGKEESWFSPG